MSKPTCHAPPDPFAPGNGETRFSTRRLRSTGGQLTGKRLTPEPKMSPLTPWGIAAKRAQFGELVHKREGRIVSEPKRGDILIYSHKHAGIVTGPALRSGVVPSVQRVQCTRQDSRWCPRRRSPRPPPALRPASAACTGTSRHPARSPNPPDPEASLVRWHVRS